MDVKSILDFRKQYLSQGGLVGKTIISGTGNEFTVVEDDKELDHVIVKCTKIVYPMAGLVLNQRRSFGNDTEVTLKE